MSRYPPMQRRTWFATLKTRSKMLIILGIALLPLGVIAIWATLNAALTTRASDAVEAQAMLSVAAQRLSSAVTRAGVTIRVTSGAIADADPAVAERACDRASAQLAESGREPVRFALYAGGNRLACHTQGFEPTPLPLLPAPGTTSVVQIDPEIRSLKITLLNGQGAAQGQIELSASLLTAVISSDTAPFPYELEISGEGGSMRLFDSAGDDSSARQINLSERLLSGRLELRLHAPAKPLSVAEIVMILLPVLMWVFAAIIGWLIVDRLLLRPLSDMQKAIAAYRPGTADFALAAPRSPAREIADLGDAFEDVTRTVARHEAELEAAVERQTRLVREVHHRVKNNLQVVASLLNIHSRGNDSVEASAAYASIQRRVDALAVVHRNHYAELEKTPGVALKALISELCASLRASAPAGASKLQIRLALEPLYANQDVAASVAFLITEVVEYAMLGGSNLVSIALDADDEPSRGRLTFESEALIGGEGERTSLQDRFERIIAGLARQLRSTPERDLEGGRYSLTIGVIGQDEG
jgi:two-component system, sensor histidine kinase PdtaS